MQPEQKDEVGAIVGLFDDEETAVEEFFTPHIVQRTTARPRPAASRPSHYKVISISLYTEDIERLGTLVQELKACGHTRANKSMVIREALRQLDVNAIPTQR
jgi:hypothetical protein